MLVIVVGPSRMGALLVLTMITLSAGAGALFRSQLPAVFQSVLSAPVQVRVSAVIKVQLVLFPELIEVNADIAVALALSESSTFTKLMATALGLMSHWVPGREDCKTISFPLLPVRVKVPDIVCVVPAVKVSTSPWVVSVKL